MHLRNELNIRLSQDNILGTSMSMQGLGGQNVKLLIDGVPVIGRQDGNVDLAQIDLTGIERAEIVEGPLSVNYGTNAFAGTINLITRKGGGRPATLKALVYTEQVGRLNTTLTATRHWKRNDVVLTAGRNFFDGWDPRDEGMPQHVDTGGGQHALPTVEAAGTIFRQAQLPLDRGSMDLRIQGRSDARSDPQSREATSTVLRDRFR